MLLVAALMYSFFLYWNGSVNINSIPHLPVSKQWLHLYHHLLQLLKQTSSQYSLPNVKNPDNNFPGSSILYLFLWYNLANCHLTFINKFIRYLKSISKCYFLYNCDNIKEVHFIKRITCELISDIFL